MSKDRKQDFVAFVTAINAGDMAAADLVLDTSDDPRGIPALLATVLIKEWKRSGTSVEEGLKRAGLAASGDEGTAI